MQFDRKCKDARTFDRILQHHLLFVQFIPKLLFSCNCQFFGRYRPKASSTGAGPNGYGDRFSFISSANAFAASNFSFASFASCCFCNFRSFLFFAVASIPRFFFNKKFLAYPSLTLTSSPFSPMILHLLIKLLPCLYPPFPSICQNVNTTTYASVRISLPIITAKPDFYCRLSRLVCISISDHCIDQCTDLCFCTLHIQSRNLRTGHINMTSAAEFFHH